MQSKKSQSPAPTPALSPTTCTSQILMSTFLTLANEEYQALANYCNSLSTLTYAYHHGPQGHGQDKKRIFQDDDDDDDHVLQNNNQNNKSHENNGIFTIDPTIFLISDHNNDSKRKNHHDQSENVYTTALNEYINSLEHLRKIHARLISCRDDIIMISTTRTSLSYNKKGDAFQAQNATNEDKVDSDLLIISKHVQLSTRVLKTCALSSMKKANGYGPFYENGLLKHLGGGEGSAGARACNQSDVLEDWHEIRSVALASYRASIGTLKNAL